MNVLRDIPVGTEEAIGTFNGKTLYRMCFYGTGSWTTNFAINPTLVPSYFDTIISMEQTYKISSGEFLGGPVDQYSNGTRLYIFATVSSAGLILQIGNYTLAKYTVCLTYTKA